ncbi:MAG: branched-chain amino acid ABC transporter permease [Proteobacteria bacterium]|nr:branched-chain amino acid ABC transporter permease [Pseudomonadota bacterium]
MPDKTLTFTSIAALTLVISGGVLPQWAIFLVTVSLCYGTVVLGMILLARTGLVSFGHGLYYCLGAYSAGTSKLFWGISDLIFMLLTAIILTATISFALGFLLRKYRSIFFAMLSLAFSMILYGLLSKSSYLGSTDGFNVTTQTIFGYDFLDSGYARYIIFLITTFTAWLCCFLMHLYLKSNKGRLADAVKDNELRVEYLGASAAKIIHTNYVISAVLAGLGGALMAISIGHIDPEMSYWTTSGEFVFITIMAGTSSVLAPFFGSMLFTTVRSFAYEYSPDTWQLLLGTTMLIIIIFLPDGLWSLFTRKKKHRSV